MSINVPEFLPVLSRGPHREGPQTGACIMEYISFLAGEKWSDMPTCTNQALALTAQRINDNLKDEDRHLLLPLIPRLMGTNGGDEYETFHQLAVSAVEYVERLVPAGTTLSADEVGSARWHLGDENDHGALMYATWAVLFSDLDNIAFLSTLIDAYDKAVGRTEPATVTADDLRRCAELTGAAR